MKLCVLSTLLWGITTAPSSNAFGPFKFVSRHVEKTPSSTIVRKFIGSSYLDSMSNDDKSTQNDATATLGNESPVVMNIAGIKPGNASDGKDFRDRVNGFKPSIQHVKVSDSFEKTTLASYSDWARKHGKETNEMRYTIYKKHYLLQIEHTKQTGQYFELNKFADLTEEEYVAARENEAKITAAAKKSVVSPTASKSGQATKMGGSYLESVSKGVASVEPSKNGVQEKSPPPPTYLDALSSTSPPTENEQQAPFIDDAGMEAYLESMEQAVAEIEALNKAPDLFSSVPEDELEEPIIPVVPAPIEEPPVLELTTMESPEATSVPIEEPIFEESTVPEDLPEKVLVATSQSSPKFVLTTAENANNDAVSSTTTTKNTSIATVIMWIRMKALKSWRMTRRVSVFSYRLASIFLVWSLQQTLRLLRLEIENA